MIRTDAFAWPDSILWMKLLSTPERLASSTRDMSAWARRDESFRPTLNRNRSSTFVRGRALRDGREVCFFGFSTRRRERRNNRECYTLQLTMKRIYALLRVSANVRMGSEGGFRKNYGAYFSVKEHLQERRQHGATNEVAEIVAGESGTSHSDAEAGGGDFAGSVG